MSNEDKPTHLITENVYFVMALQCAVVITIIEALGIAISPAAAPIIYPAGWILIFGVAFWRAQPLSQGFLKANRPSIAKFLGGLALIGMSSGFLYLCLTLPLSISMPSPEADGVMWRIKYAAILNAIAGVDAAVMTILGTYILGQRICVSSRVK